MSRRHATSNTRPPSPPSSTPPAPGARAAVASDLPFRLAVDDVLAQMAAERGDSDGSEVPDPVTHVAAPAAPAPPLDAPASTLPSRMISTSVPVAGMTCRACEVRIQKQVGRLPNVRRVRASAVHGRVEIESSEPVPAAALEKAISAAGYRVGRTPWLERSPAVWSTAAAGLLLVAALALFAQVTGLADLAGGVGDLGQGGLAVALLLGLAAGVSTCMALVGGLVLALSASFQASRPASGAAGGGLGTQMRPAALFVAGRIAGYALFGAALGALGASITLPPQVTAALMVVAAVVMIVLGTRLTGLSPRIATWSPTLPLGLGRRLGLADGGSGTYSDGRAAVLGAASFFLPCGFTQAVQIFALATGSPLVAGAIMAVFAIGTAPGLLALAGLPVVVPGTMRPTLLRLVGVVVLAFAFLNAGAALQLAGIALPSLGAGAAAAAPPPASVPAAGGAQELTTFQDAAGYSPADVSIYAGIPTRWTIESTNDRTCAVFLVVPSLGIQARLQKGSNTIDLPALEPGTLAYSCSMGMYGGRITVVEPPTGLGGASAGGG